jgi:D-sedoheptulose 7-phosphate isomerase
MENVDNYLSRLRAAVDVLPRERLAELGELLYRNYRNAQQVFTLGNGGSASTASHMAADLSKNTIGANMRRFRVLSLNDNQALLTALANDVGYENVFAEQLKNLIRPAQTQCAQVVGILGFEGGEATRLVDLSIVVPCDHYGIVEDVHLIINHILVDYFNYRLADDRQWVV